MLKKSMVMSPENIEIMVMAGATNIIHGSNNSQVVNDYNQYQTKPFNKNEKNSYNINKEIATDDFRRIQEESRRMSDTESLLYH